MKMNSVLFKIFIITVFLFLNVSSKNIKYQNKSINYEKTFYNSLLNFHKKIPLSKIYIHTDKLNYAAGEIIYFKAYIINFHNLTLDSTNTNLYIELIDPFKNIIIQKRFLIKNGTSFGTIFIPDTLIDGIYQLRSYTNFMRNFDEKFFFSQNILIKNLSNNIQPYSLKMYKKLYKNYIKNKKKFFVKIYQDNIVKDNKVVKKVVVLIKDYFNNPISTNVKLLDLNKHPILENTTNKYGICNFYLEPKYKKYYISISYYSKVKKIRFYLLSPNLPFFNIYEDIENILISISKESRSENDLIFIIQNNGNILYLKSIDKNLDKLIINKNILPAGLLTFTLFSSDYNVLCEKLYVNAINNETPIIKFSLEQDKNHTSQRILYIFSDTNNANISNISIAINNEIDSLNSLNIKNYILYGSDIGLNNNESSIFNNINELKDFINNEYLATFRWDRFFWNDILKNIYPSTPYKIEKGITITGKITTEFFSIPLKNCPVKLYVLNNYNDVYNTNTDDNGNFVFENLYYYDDIDIKIEAFKPNHKRNLLIVLPDKPSHKIKNFYPEQQFTLNIIKSYQNQKLVSNSSFKGKQEITTEKEKKNIIEGIYGSPDYVITSDQIPPGYTNILQVLQGRVPGVDVNGNNVIIRGVKTLYGNTDPLYLIDGVPVADVNAVLFIPVEDVERIEIIKGPSSAIYGSRGANGIIAVYTKRGQFLKKGIVELKIQGFTKPQTFQQKQLNDKIPVTLYWEPEVIIANQNIYKINFTVPQNINNYNIIIQGITSNGKVISYILKNQK